MRRILLGAALACTLQISAQENLEGFFYGSMRQPNGNEWQDPEQLALNKEQPVAYAFHFASDEEALKVLPENSSYYQNLNGTWKFYWVAKPEDRPEFFYMQDYDVSDWADMPVPSCWNIQGIQKDGSLKYGVPIYVNQKVIFQHKVAVDDWKGGVMRTPPSDWTTFKYPNEVGSYRRNFTVPKDWSGREVYLNFDGVDSFFYLWVNGKYVGFRKNSRNTARFDITSYLKSGENVVALEVYRNSDASFLESQDMFRLPGIIRDVYLTSAPKVQIQDLVIQTTSIDGEAKFKVSSVILNKAQNTNAVRRTYGKTTPAPQYFVSYQVFPVRCIPM